MSPDEQAALDFMHAMQKEFGDFKFRVVTPRFVAVSPGVNPDVPLGEDAAGRPRRGGLLPPAADSARKSAAEALRRVKG